MSATVDVARSPLPEGVGEYEGRWIAIRDGQIVAAADVLEDLIQDEDVRETDVLYRVPEHGSYFY